MTEPDNLTAALGRMTVGDLARRLNVDVDALVLAVLQRRTDTNVPAQRPAAAAAAKPRPKASPRRAPARSRGAQATASRTKRPKTASNRPPTRKEIHRAVDRWFLAELFEEEGGNVSAVARRIGSPRTALRKRWARAAGLHPNTMEDLLARVDAPSAPPTKAKLRALGSYRAIHDALDRWLLQAALPKDGNVSRAAARLGVSRRVVRRLRDEIGTR